MSNKLLLIDDSIKGLSTFLQALQPTTKYITFNYDNETLANVKNKIAAFNLTFSHVGIVQDDAHRDTYLMMASMQPCRLRKVQTLDPNLTTWSEFSDFINYLKQTVSMTNLDFFLCQIYEKPYWKFIIDKLVVNTSISIGASTGQVGNSAVGGTWVLQSNNTNVKDVYLTDAISLYPFTFDGNNSHFMVICNNHTVYGWGANWSGQLGINNTNWPITTPTLLLNPDGNGPLEGVIQLSMGSSHSLFLVQNMDNTTTLYACGQNNNGQLGNNSTNYSPLCVEVLLQNVFQMSAGYISSGAVTASGELFMWGSNCYGQLGFGYTDNNAHALPLLVTFPQPEFFVQVSAARYGNVQVLALTQDKTAYAWGSYIYNSQLHAPQIILDEHFNVLQNIVQIDGDCVLLENGNVYRILFYQGSDPTYHYKPVATLIYSPPSGRHTKKIAVGQTGYLLLLVFDDELDTNIILGQGVNYYGNLGNGTSNDVYIPDFTTVIYPSGDLFMNAIQVSSGYETSMSILKNGEVYTWGYNGYGELGQGGNDNNGTHTTPVKVTLPYPVLGYYPLVSNICFPGNTPILTDQGIVAISDIDPNVHTIRKQKILAVTKTVSQDTHLICFEKGSLDQNHPTKKTTMTKDHCIFYKGSMRKAQDFVGKFKGVYEVEYKGEFLYNILMKTQNYMFVNNLFVETLDPKNIVAKIQTSNLNFNEKNKLIAKLNKCIKTQNSVEYNNLCKQLQSNEHPPRRNKTKTSV
jgi:alpha-tubulin suppressor-like RCC1 family protein